jgi:hypothetical protein
MTLEPFYSLKFSVAKARINENSQEDIARVGRDGATSDPDPARPAGGRHELELFFIITGTQDDHDDHVE